MDKDKKELLKSLENSASTKIDLNKVRDDWKKVEQNAETIYFNEEQVDNLINAIEKCKNIEIKDIDVISKLEKGRELLKELLDKNIKRNSEGRVLISKDDEWREETEWDELIKTINEDDPDNDDKYCTVEESLRESLKQMKLMREGKIPKRSWNDIKLTKEQRLAARQDILTDDDTYLYLYEEDNDNLYDKPIIGKSEYFDIPVINAGGKSMREMYLDDENNECDVIADIFKQAIDKQNLNKEDIIKMIEEEKIFRKMELKQFDKNCLFDDDEDLQEVYKEMLTQIAPTPILYGEEARQVIKEAKTIPSERSKENGQKLVNYFNKFYSK